MSNLGAYIKSVTVAERIETCINAQTITIINGSKKSRIKRRDRKSLPTREECQELLKTLLFGFYQLMTLDYLPGIVLGKIHEMNGRISSTINTDSDIMILDHSSESKREKFKLASYHLGTTLHRLCTITEQLDANELLTSMEWYFTDSPTSPASPLVRDEKGRIPMLYYERMLLSLVPVYFRLVQLHTVSKSEILSEFRSIIEYSMFIPSDYSNGNPRVSVEEVIRIMMDHVLRIMNSHGMQVSEAFIQTDNIYTR